VIRARIVYDVEGWAYYRRARILEEYQPDDIEITIAPHRRRFEGGPFDLIFDMNYGHVLRVRADLQRYPNTVLLVSFNNGWPNRLDHFGATRAHAHAVLVNNRDFWQRAGRPRGVYQISNGVDRRVFNCRKPMASRAPVVAWIGSDYHRKLKGYDDFLVPLAQRLREVAVCDFRVVDPYTANGGAGSGAGGQALSHAELADWYNEASVYVVASETEGTPNPALEAASCGCVLVTTRVGNMPELVQHGDNGLFVDRALDSIEAGVREALERRVQLSEGMLREIAAWDWRPRVEAFYTLFRQLVNNEAPLLRPRGSK
jgi:glycosyltransferase involved in cell wall biosynthesis